MLAVASTATPVAAQGAGGVSVALMAGGRAVQGGSSGTVGVEVAYRLSPDFVAEAGAMAVLADETYPGWLVGFRFEPGQGRFRLTSGVTAGAFHHAGFAAVTLAVELGARWQVLDRLGLAGEGSLQMINSVEGPGLGVGFALGAFVPL